jgi:hypothetical protein
LLGDSSLIRDKLPEIALLGAIASYTAAMLFLTVLGSPVFFYGCYIGTFLAVAAVMAKMDMFAYTTRGHVLFIILIFASAMFFTTALVSVFTEVGIAVHGFYDVKHIQYGSLYWQRSSSGAIGTYQPNGCFETQPFYSYAGYALEILRPWSWLAGPALIGGSLLFVIAIIVMYRSE